MKIESLLPYAALGCAFVSRIYLKKIESTFKAQAIAQKSIPPVSFSVMNIPSKFGITTVDETKKIFKLSQTDQSNLIDIGTKILR
jgi:hypothetical protein